MVNNKAFEEFREHRDKELKKPLTPLGEKKARKKLEGLSLEDQATIIDYSIECGYRGLFPDILKRQGNAKNRGNSTEQFYSNLENYHERKMDS